MKYRSGLIFFLGAIASLVLGFAKSSSLDKQIPMHWNIAGKVDGYGNRFEALYFVPGVLCVLALIFGLIGVIASSRLGPNTIKALNIVSAALVAFLVILHNSLLSGNPQAVPGLIMLAMPALMLVSGIAIKGVEPNPFVGIRVSWTLNNSVVWRKSHDRASKLWIVGGIAGIILSLLGVSMAIVLPLVFILFMYPLLDSYLISKSQS